MTKNTTPHESWEQQSLVAELERLEPGILMEINPAAGMKLDKRMAATVKTLATKPERWIYSCRNTGFTSS